MDAVDQSAMGGSHYATPFILQRDTTNRYRVDRSVNESMEQSTQIPFLREHRIAKKFSSTHTGAFTGGY